MRAMEKRLERLEAEAGPGRLVVCYTNTDTGETAWHVDGVLVDGRPDPRPGDQVVAFSSNVGDGRL